PPKTPERSRARGGENVSRKNGAEASEFPAEDIRASAAEEKAKKIKTELTRLKKVVKELTEGKRRIVDGLVQEAAFMRATLEETREIIDREGVIELFEQGAQRFLREHPATKVYASLINRYSAVVKQLIDLLPDGDKQKTEADELMAFVKRRSK